MCGQKRPLTFHRWLCTLHLARSPGSGSTLPLPQPLTQGSWEARGAAAAFVTFTAVCFLSLTHCISPGKKSQRRKLPSECDELSVQLPAAFPLAGEIFQGKGAHREDNSHVVHQCDAKLWVGRWCWHLKTLKLPGRIHSITSRLHQRYTHFSDLVWNSRLNACVSSSTTHTLTLWKYPQCFGNELRVLFLLLFASMFPCTTVIM